LLANSDTAIATKCSICC